MAYLCIASYCTEENGRLKYAKRCMYSLLDTVDFNKHRLGIYLNAPSAEAKKFYEEFAYRFCLNFNPDNLIIIEDAENVGTAKAVNSIMYLRKEGEKCIKMDDDVVFNKIGWVDEMEDALSRLTNIGILGLLHALRGGDAARARAPRRLRRVRAVERLGGAAAQPGRGDGHLPAAGVHRGGHVASRRWSTKGRPASSCLKGDVEALRDRLARFRRDPGLVREMGARARKVAEERYSVERMMREYLALYQA